VADPAEYRETMMKVALLAQLAADLPVSEMLSAINRADSVGHIVDPTLYRAKHKAMCEDADMLRAIAPLVALGKKLRALQEGGGTG
jgi:hypothetical protein